MNVDLRAYVEALETHLSRLRGRDSGLTPPEFALARSWHAAGVDLGRVLVALDAHAERHSTVSLSAVRRTVEREDAGRG